MKGLAKYERGPGGVRIGEVPEPTLRPGHVIVEVAAAGVCGTDLHIEADEYPVHPPVVMGHEFSGTVVEEASDVTGEYHGRRVTCLPYFTTCGVCEYCRTAQWNLCPSRRSVGSGVNGAFARYVLVPQSSVRLLPENVDLLAGALTEPLACCAHAVMDKATIKAGDVVVVVGPGAIGLLTAQVAVASGAEVVIAGTSSDAPRLELARELGVQHAIDVEAQPAMEFVKELSDGHGADAVFECSGAAGGARLAYELVRPRGQYVQVGLFGKPIQLNVDLAVIKEVDIRNSFASTWKSWEYALRLLGRGSVRTRPLVTDALPLDEWEKAFDGFRKKQGIKYVLLPGE